MLCLKQKEKKKTFLTSVYKKTSKCIHLNVKDPKFQNLNIFICNKDWLIHLF